MSKTRPWIVRDELWEQVKPLIPAVPSHAKGGCPRMDVSLAFEAIIYVLRTDMQWNALPRESGLVRFGIISWFEGSPLVTVEPFTSRR